MSFDNRFEIENYTIWEPLITRWGELSEGALLRAEHVIENALPKLDALDAAHHATQAVVSAEPVAQPAFHYEDWGATPTPAVETAPQPEASKPRTGPPKDPQDNSGESQLSQSISDEEVQKRIKMMEAYEHLNEALSGK